MYHSQWHVSLPMACITPMTCITPHDIYHSPWHVSLPMTCITPHDIYHSPWHVSLPMTCITPHDIYHSHDMCRASVTVYFQFHSIRHPPSETRPLLQAYASVLWVALQNHLGFEDKEEIPKQCAGQREAFCRDCVRKGRAFCGSLENRNIETSGLQYSTSIKEASCQAFQSLLYKLCPKIEDVVLKLWHFKNNFSFSSMGLHAVPGFVRALLQINLCIIVANGWKRFIVFTHLYPLQLFAWNEFATKRFRNGPLATKRFQNGTEKVHLQRNDSL
jgi:hypothetical protein